MTRLRASVERSEAWVVRHRRGGLVERNYLRRVLRFTGPDRILCTGVITLAWEAKPHQGEAEGGCE